MQHNTTIQVRFGDIDRLGHVNNAVYLTYFELARVTFCNDLLGYDVDWSKMGIILARADVNYIKPVTLHDDIYVSTECTRIGSKSFDLSYKLFKREEGSETEMASGSTVQVCFNYEIAETVIVPQLWRDRLESQR